MERKLGEPSLGLTPAAIGASVVGSGPSQPGEEMTVKFACIGDWGTPTPALNAVAKHMTNTLDDIDFVVALGDNFYFTGVKSTEDRHWYNVFEEPFRAVDCPWYPILGNHDWEGDPYAQLAYSQLNPKWKMYSLYYKHTFGNGLVDVFFLDTTTLCPRESNALTMKGFDDDDCEPQYEWLEQQLRASTARWKIICGHYPVYSNGENGSTVELQRLEKLMQQYQVDTYICGHDHSMQHMFNNESGIHYFVAGSGSSARYFRSSFTTVQMRAETVWKSLDRGYLHCTVALESIKLNYINTTGKSSYEYTIHKIMPLQTEHATFCMSDSEASSHFPTPDSNSSDCRTAATVTTDDVVFAFANQSESASPNMISTRSSEESSSLSQS
jgi:tartrate-resistant acid phosphatase type 5